MSLLKSKVCTPVEPEFCAMETLNENLDRFVTPINEIKREMKEVSCPNMEANTIIREKL